ncbi:hypothetical protein BKA56DRAFT_622643 [Ilyonectria sp. MPI-CAGE-AT-0026]|nr:hypothetical protein BKA56DRAFT_622643 [Ilyonectria sp. MPI-CAGE-AT-0026]
MNKATSSQGTLSCILILVSQMFDLGAWLIQLFIPTRYQELDQQGRQLRHIPGPSQRLALSGHAVTHSPSLLSPLSFSWFKPRDNHWANDDSQASILTEVAASSQDPTLLHPDAPIIAVRYTTLSGQPPSPISLSGEDSHPPTASLRGCSNNLGQVPQPYNESSKTPRAEEDNLESRLVNDYNGSATNAISQNYLDCSVNPGFPTQYLHQTGEDGVLTSSTAIMEAFTSGYHSPNTETSWISGPSSQCHLNDGSRDAESSDVQSLLQTPDGIIAFNLFSAYIEESMNKPEAWRRGDLGGWL